ncbi:MAG: Gfo/Idh/MocA family oxidoreductase [Tumebacillaceae bacterium]
MIGTGVMGRNHVRVLASMTNMCQLVGVYDVDPIRASQVAREFGVQSFVALDDLLKQVDAVTIAVSIPEHYAIGLTCIAHKKHMLMEKPITETSTQAAELIAKAKENGVLLQVGHIELFNPAIQVLRNVMAQEEIIAVDIHRMSHLEPRMMNVDVVKDSMLHDIYVLFTIFGERVKTMYAVGRVYHDTIKHAVALLEFPSGVVAQVTASFLTEEKVRTIRVITRNAFIQADLLDKKIVITRATNFYLDKTPASYSQQNIIEKVVVPMQEPLRAQFEHFLSCIQQNIEPAVTGDDGRNALAMAERISQAILQQKQSGGS